LFGVREAARQSRDLKFTALLHHVNEELLTSSFCELKKNAAVGIDAMTWQEYEGDLEERIADPWSNSPRRLSGETIASGVHTEVGWSTATVGDCFAGG
jgi:hypothetical protein